MVAKHAATTAQNILIPRRGLKSNLHASSRRLERVRGEKRSLGEKGPHLERRLSVGNDLLGLLRRHGKARKVNLSLEREQPGLLRERDDATNSSLLIRAKAVMLTVQSFQKRRQLR